MRTIAVAARRWAVSTWLAAGARPMIAPPLRLDTFDPATIEGADLLYVCLHGLPGQPYWYGDGWETAISADQIDRANLSGTIVYLAGCHGQGPMTDALLAAGARAVVGSAAEVWGSYYWPSGTNARGRAFRRSLERGLNVAESVLVARNAISVRPDSTLTAYGDIAATVKGIGT